MKLGTKVKCKGYLKKVETKHVALESERSKFKTAYELKQEFKDMALWGVDKEFSYEAFMDVNEVLFVDCDDDLCQTTKDIIPCKFEGIIVARKRVPTKRWFSIIEQEYGHKIETQIFKEESNYVDCYQVFFRIGGSRLVPVKMCEVILCQE